MRSLPYRSFWWQRRPSAGVSTSGQPASHVAPHRGLHCSIQRSQHDSCNLFGRKCADLWVEGSVGPSVLCMHHCQRSADRFRRYLGPRAHAVGSPQLSDDMSQAGDPGALLRPVDHLALSATRGRARSTPLFRAASLPPPSTAWRTRSWSLKRRRRQILRSGSHRQPVSLMLASERSWEIEMRML